MQRVDRFAHLLENLDSRDGLHVQIKQHQVGFYFEETFGGDGRGGEGGASFVAGFLQDAAKSGGARGIVIHDQETGIGCNRGWINHVPPYEALAIPPGRGSARNYT